MNRQKSITIKIHKNAEQHTKYDNTQQKKLHKR